MAVQCRVVRVPDDALDAVRTRGFVIIEDFLALDELRAAQQALWLHFPTPEEYFADPLNPDKAVYKGAIPFRLTPGLTRRRTSRKDCAQLQYR